jgi:hypothetical protein
MQFFHLVQTEPDENDARGLCSRSPPRAPTPITSGAKSTTSRCTEKPNASAVTTQEFVTVAELTRLLEQERSKKQPDDLTYEHYPPYQMSCNTCPTQKDTPL